MDSSSTSSPVSGPDSAQWAPSMPNSDLYTLMSVKDHLEVVTPAGAQRAPHARRVMAIRTSPLARFPPVSAASLLAAQAAAVAAATASTTAATQGLIVSATPSTETTASPSPEPTTALPRTRQHRPRCMPTSTPSTSSAASSSSASSTSPSPSTSPASTQAVVSRTRINSSTIKKRTERFPGRVLNSIAEDPTATVSESTSARPVLAVRKRSYAAATTSTSTTDRVPSSPTLHTGRRTTPTSSTPRCAQATPGNATATTPGIALPPRYTSSGTPLAGPQQVMSPRTLLAPYSGSPCFQSLDGAVGRIMADKEVQSPRAALGKNSEGKDMEEGIWREVVSEADRKGHGCTYADETLYREDTLIKLRYQTSLKMRVAARRLKTLF
ncbi:hypothetical protein C8R43DRAFT_1178127 [Mycena crocata]|nr:hypothetical protein C8R43DRAFT_1178127 [Mycena crocata]